MRNYICILSLIFTIISVSCSTGRKVTSGNSSDNLNESQRRRFEYFFIEGAKQKQLGNHDTAFELYRKALAIDTASAQTKYELANYYLRLNRPLIALDYLENAYKKDPANFWYAMTLAGLYQNMNKDDQAVKVYESMSKSFPGKPEIYYALSDAYAKIGENILSDC